jgi:CcmD family protein
MMMLRCPSGLVLALLLLTSGFLAPPLRAAVTDGRVPEITLAIAQPPGPIEQQDEFRPISELPPQDQLPAAPLLVTAYTVVVLALFAYLFSVTRRLMGVQHELERLEADMKRTRK